MSERCPTCSSETDGELARLLEAMQDEDHSISLAWISESREWVCDWIWEWGIFNARAKTALEAVRACWERGQGS